jgi:hypothetical protein
VKDFLEEIGFTLQQAAGYTDDLPHTTIVGLPYEHGKPFANDEELINLPT